jgi:hypothetical protein
MIARHKPSVFTETLDKLYSLDSHVLDEKSLSAIKDIASQVTSSSYQRTPNFNMRRGGGGGGGGGGGSRGQHPRTNSRGFPNASGRGGRSRPQGNNHHHHNHPPQEVRDMSEEEWQVLREFESTKMKKKEGTELSITKITGEMNKLTKDTFDTIVQTVTDEVNRARDLDEDMDVDVGMKRIASAMFDIASNNKFYSGLYAQFASKMIETFGEMKPMIQSKFADTSKIIANIRYCSPDDDYDQFCENNKQNDKRRALCSFYANLLMQDIICVSDIFETIIRFQTELSAGASDKALRGKNEEIAEVTYILISESKDKLVSHASWDRVINEVKQVTDINTKEFLGITSKTVFRFMDIVDGVV